MKTAANTGAAAIADLPRDRPLIDASLWSADLGALRADAQRVAPHVDMFHLDAADARFTPTLVFFPDLVAALHRSIDVPLHVHLMAADPAALAEQFADAGADLITVHAEVGPAAVAEAVAAIRAAGKAAGIALRADTPVGALAEYLDGIDAVVMIGTPLGTKGTEAGPAAIARILELRRRLDADAATAPIRILADGGIRSGTVPHLIAAGADGVVAGSLLFGAADPAAACDQIRAHRREQT